MFLAEQEAALSWRPYEYLAVVGLAPLLGSSHRSWMEPCLAKDEGSLARPTVDPIAEAHPVVGGAPCRYAASLGEVIPAGAGQS